MLIPFFIGFLLVFKGLFFFFRRFRAICMPLHKAPYACGQETARICFYNLWLTIQPRLLVNLKFLTHGKGTVSLARLLLLEGIRCKKNIQHREFGIAKYRRKFASA